MASSSGIFPEGYEAPRRGGSPGEVPPAFGTPVTRLRWAGSEAAILEQLPQAEKTLREARALVRDFEMLGVAETTLTPARVRRNEALREVADLRLDLVWLGAALDQVGADNAGVVNQA